MEYQRQYHKDNKEKRNKMRAENYRKKHPNYKPRITHYDFETHRELAMNSGIRTSFEWHECHELGLMPDGIYHAPDKTFSRSE